MVAEDDSEALRIPSWALSTATFLVLLALVGLAVFGAYYYLRAQRLTEQINATAPDTRTRELQRAILDQQDRVQSLQDDYNALTRQVEERQNDVTAQVDRLSAQLRELDRLANEVRGLLGLPQAAPTPAPTPRSDTPSSDTFAHFLPRGGSAPLTPYDIAFPAIDPDPQNVALRLSVVRAQVTWQTASYQALRAEILARRATQQAEAERARAEAEAARQAAEAAAKAKIEAEMRVAQVQAQQAAQRAGSSDPQLAQLDRQVNDVIDRLRKGEFVAPQPRQVLAAPLPKTGPGAPGRWPLKGDITSPFGLRTFRDATDWHTGIDISVDMNTPVHVTQGGTIVFAGWQAGYGWCVEVGHGQEFSTLYGHLSRLLTDVGETVEAGDVIGLSGSSGNSTGPHLHYEIRLNGKAINPAPYLP